jgi:excinuclease ABC subunit C
VLCALDRVAGVGPKRKALLLKRFGGIKQIRAATVDELSELPGITSSLATAIKQALA